MIELTLPWPPSTLSPNARSHWAVLSKAKKAYREACAWTAKGQGLKPAASSRLHLSLTFYPPTRRAFDLDNCLARMKSGLDGLADVLEVDDKDWSLSIQKADQVGGFVKVFISEAHATQLPTA
jgi:crossover junction endodeoxyribonuclease RusA